MKEGKEFSKDFYFSLVIIAAVTLIIGFSFLPSTRFDTFIGTGDSMKPALLDGDELLVDPKRTPRSGDIVVFSCLSCDDLSEDEILTKRLIDVDGNGCYWLLGDNQATSLDSRSLGWLCEDEIDVFGVVVKVN